MVNIELIFANNDGEYGKFEMVEDKLSNRPDLCAFLLIDKLLGGSRDMVCASEHDQFYLEADCEVLSLRATEGDIITLIRCGVMFDSETDSLAMFA